MLLLSHAVQTDQFFTLCDFLFLILRVGCIFPVCVPTRAPKGLFAFLVVEVEGADAVALVVLEWQTNDADLANFLDRLVINCVDVVRTRLGHHLPEPIPSEVDVEACEALVVGTAEPALQLFDRRQLPLDISPHLRGWEVEIRLNIVAKIIAEKEW